MKKILLVAALMSAAAVQPGHAAGDAVAGATVFKRCAACHSIGEGAEHKVGPELNAVLGRAAGSVEGFSYSQELTDAGAAGLIWIPETLVPWLRKPKDFVPGTKMSFAGLPNPVDIDNIIAYLATFSPEHDPSAMSSAPAN